MIRTLGIGAAVLSAARAETDECKTWAAAGECINNPTHMLIDCRAACSNRPPPNPDYACDKWAEADECSKNSKFMNLHCADACGHRWLWAPDARRAIGLPDALPVAPPRRPAEAALFDGTRIALDGRAALEERVAEFEGIVLRGELPADVVLPSDSDAQAVSAVAEQYALYAARLLRAIAPPDDANARRAAEDAEANAIGALDGHRDPRRLDWALRELPHIAINLRRAIAALPPSWEGKLVIEAAKPETGSSWWRKAAPKRATVPLPRAGTKLPALGLGTCWLNEHETEASVSVALAWAAAHPAAPPVHIDSAEAYRNEAAVGRAITAAGGPGRAFLASKLSDRAKLSYAGAKARVAETLTLFGVETLDLYSLHSAFNFLHDAAARADLAGAWRALVELQKDGTLRALGVSNFNAQELQAFAADPALGGIWFPDCLQNKVDARCLGDNFQRVASSVAPLTQYAHRSTCTEGASRARATTTCSRPRRTSVSQSSPTAP